MPSVFHNDLNNIFAVHFNSSTINQPASLMRKISGYIAIVLISIFFISCGNNNTKSGSETSDTSSVTTSVTQSDFGEVDGKKVLLYTITNKKGSIVKITNYGATVTSWITADISGNKSNIVLGFDSIQGYLNKPPYFGSTIGRYGNRIANAQFKIGENTYKLAANDGKNHLHGGIKGFDKVVWDVAPLDVTSSSLTLNYLSKDGEEGYPGNLKTTVKFTLTDDDELQIVYDAETDKPPTVNLTNHSYFNLTGDVSNTILNHSLMIDADRYTPVDATLIPTGQLAPVKGTPFDFTKAEKIGARIAAVKGGYDHNFVLNNSDNSMKKVAELSDSLSGRKLEVFTTEPGLQFYTGNFLNGELKTSGGKAVNKHSALCLETQHFPDSPNKPSFPSTILQPGQKYHTTTTYKVSVAK